jgi:hypothetical protein
MAVHVAIPGRQMNPAEDRTNQSGSDFPKARLLFEQGTNRLKGSLRDSPNLRHRVP